MNADIHELFNYVGYRQRSTAWRNFTNGNGFNLAAAAHLTYNDHYFQSEKKSFQFVRQKTEDRSDNEVVIPIIPPLQAILDQIAAPPVKGSLVFPGIYGDAQTPIERRKRVAMENQNIKKRIRRLVLKGAGTPYDSLTSPFEYKNMAFTKLRSVCKQRTHNELLDTDYESWGIINENGELTNAGALIADESPVRHSRVFCTRWNGLTKAPGLVDAIDELVTLTGISRRQVLRYVKELTEDEVIRRDGGRKLGKWVILKEYSTKDSE